VYSLLKKNVQPMRDLNPWKRCVHFIFVNTVFSAGFSATGDLVNIELFSYARSFDSHAVCTEKKTLFFARINLGSFVL